jgi:hypothetical protein
MNRSVLVDSATALMSRWSVQITELHASPESNACEFGIAERDAVGIPHDHQHLTDQSIGARSVQTSALSLPEVVLTLVKVRLVWNFNIGLRSTSPSQRREN